MLAHERQEQILDIIQKEGSVKVSKLTKLFDVSIETIRRDLESLENNGLLKRVYGGAILKKNVFDKLNFTKREKAFKDEKKEIAQIAIRYVEEGQSIALNGGTTNLEIVRELREKFKNLTIITNSLMIANELSDVEGFTIILIGGVLNNKEYAFYSEFTENILSNFVIDTAFISVSGVSLNRGITDYLINEVKIQKKIMEVSQEVIILADSSKIDSASLVKTANIDDVNLIITDSKLDSKILNKYLKNGIEIINK